jgi:hypothetical protein
MSLRETYGTRPDGWIETQEQIFRVWIDKECYGFPFFSLLMARYAEDGRLHLHFPYGTIVVTGPKVLSFYDQFASNHATQLKADGKDIVSVTLVSDEA